MPIAYTGFTSVSQSSGLYVAIGHDIEYALQLHYLNYLESTMDEMQCPTPTVDPVLAAVLQTWLPNPRVPHSKL